jgi:hypothetical protein
LPACEQGGAAVRFSYGERAGLWPSPGNTQANRDAYYDRHRHNYRGTTTKDLAVDIDGGIFTLGYYATPSRARRWQCVRCLMANVHCMGKDPVFQTQHILSPTRGVALFINASTSGAGGPVEKAASLLSALVIVGSSHRHRLAHAAHGHDRSTAPAAGRAVGGSRLVRRPDGPVAALDRSPSGSVSRQRIIRSHPAGRCSCSMNIDIRLEQRLRLTRSNAGERGLNCQELKWCGR